MLSVPVTLLVATVYLVLLFTIAYRGDRKPPNQVKPYRYALAQGVHCTSWAFYGTVTQSAHYGWSFAPTYVGAILVFLFAHRLQLKLLHVCKQQNITSIADLVGHRYGKSPILGATVAIIALVAVVPYISLQLRAVTASFAAVTGVSDRPEYWFGDVSALVALAMIGFAILFGTRRLSLAEQHAGLMDAIAFESVVKLLAFMAMGLYCSYVLFDGLGDLIMQAAQDPVAQQALTGQPNGGYIYATHILLGALSMFCLPRQFHVAYIENTHPDELRAARWAFPLYLFAINFFILPIALAGLLLTPLSANSDTLMLALPLLHGRPDIALIAFVGGLSAATSMVIIATLALSIMMSNDVIMPLWLRITRKRLRQFSFNPGRILGIRRITVVLIIALSYGYHLVTQATMPLVNSGLIALSLLAQLAPSMLGGLVWSKANKAGTAAGLLAGTTIWFIYLLLPTLQTDRGLSDVAISDGLLLSLGVNIALFLCVPIIWPAGAAERRQQQAFLQPHLMTSDAGGAPTVNWGRLRATIARFFDAVETEKLAHRLGLNLTSAPNEALVPAPILGRIEREFSAIIGSAASRLLLDAVAQQPSVPISQVVNWATQASQLYRFNRELLQASVENIPQGISVIDRDLRLVAWNRRYLEVFQYPEGFVQAGMPVAELLRYNAERGMFGNCDDDNQDQLENEIDKRLNYLKAGSSYRYQRQQGDHVIELQGSPMPGGGFVTTYTDITDLFNTQRQLQRMNAELEQRVDARTYELLQAKQAEERAHQSKTRFFAAVSHDLMQPFNAATLFCEMLSQRLQGDNRQLADHIHQSLHHAEELLTMLLEMTRLEAGNLRVNQQQVSLHDVLQPLVDNTRVLAQDKQVALSYVSSSAIIHTDRKLLGRIVQNLLSNAVRYTDQGHILIGCRRHSEHGQQQVTLWIADTGVGIPEDKKDEIFREFHQLESNGDNPGLGLGLAIVERMCRLLSIPLTFSSQVGRGTCFKLRLPVVGWQRPQMAKQVRSALTDRFLESKQILVIDNDQAVLNAMQGLLSDWGAQVSTANSVHSISFSTLQKPVVMIVDYHLDHGETGIHVLQHVRQYFNADIPAIINSADPDDGIREQAVAARASFIPKPVKPAALKRLLKRVLTS